MPPVRLAFVAAVAGLVLAHAPVAQAELNPQQVREAIDSGIKYLKRTQQANGSWPDYQNHQGGVTGFCTLALLNSGLGRHDFGQTGQLYDPRILSELYLDHALALSAARPEAAGRHNLHK